MNKELIEAVNSGNAEEVRRLISEEGRVEDVDVEDAFLAATSQDQAEIVGMLLKDERVDSKDINRLLDDAINADKLKVARVLLESERVDQSSVERALIMAACNGNTEVVRVLLEGEPVDQMRVGRVLCMAAFRGQAEIVGMLLKDERFELSGTDLNLSLDFTLNQDQPEVVRILMADERVDSKDINRLLDDAINADNLKFARVLLESERVDQSGVERVFAMAVSKGNTEVVRVLLEDERVDQRGAERALAVAAYNGNTEVVRMLLADERVDQRVFEQAFKRVANPMSDKAVRLLMVDKRAQSSIDVALQRSDEMEYRVVAKFLLSQGVKVVTDGEEYSSLPQKSRDNLLACKAAQDAIASSVKSCPRAVDKKFVELVSAADVFSSKKSIAEISAPKSKKFIDEAVLKASELDTRMQHHDKGTRDFVAKNSHLIDDSLTESNPKKWDMGRYRWDVNEALVNLAVLHGDKITGIEELQGAGVKVVKDFIDHIPEKDGRIGKYSVGEYEARVLGKDVLYGKDKVLNMNAMKEVLKYLKPGDIRLAETKAHHVPAPRSPQHAGKKVDDKKEQGSRGGKGGGMGGR